MSIQPRPLCLLFLAGTMLCAATARARPVTAEDLVALPRVSGPVLAPDGGAVFFEMSTVSEKGPKPGTARRHAVMRVAADGSGGPVRLADGSDPRPAPDGRRVFFLAPDHGTTQVWSVASDGTGRPQRVTDLPTDVETYRLAPDGRTLVVALAVVPGHETIAAIKADLAADAAKRGSGRLYDHLFVRHWDSWSDGRRNHLFAVRLGADGRAAGDLVPLTAGMDGDVPSKPFGDADDFVIAPDSRSVLFSIRLAGRSEPWSTNFDVWQVALPAAGESTAGAPRNLTAANPAWDGGPVFAPDGRTLAWRAMKRPGFEADRFGVVTAQQDGSAAREIDAAWDRSAERIAFTGDSRALYVEATDLQSTRLFRMDASSGTVAPITGQGHVTGFDVAHTPAGDVLAYAADTMAAPTQIFVRRPDGRTLQLTHAGADRLRDITMSPYRSFTFAGWNNESVHGWILEPTGFQAGRRYPTVFLIHGGPQGSWEDGWSTRWNPEVWAGWGYGVVTVDFHGSTGYGQAFTDAISGHWGDRPLEDLQKGWAAAQKEAPWIDASKACAAGASYGGFMIYWIAGNWNAPWKCLVDHDGVFDNRIMGYATEELWFSEWENGHATVWEQPANYERFNPINHVAEWKDPMLVIHSAKDYRIPLDQGLAAFTALQRRGIPSEFLTFPDENHWVLKPANSLEWHAGVHDWLKRWIGPS